MVDPTQRTLFLGLTISPKKYDSDDSFSTRRKIRAISVLLESITNPTRTTVFPY